MQAKLQLARYRIMANEFENEEIEDGLDEDEYPKQNEKDLSNKKESHRKEKISKINKKRKKEKEIENSDESSISLKEINKIENHLKQAPIRSGLRINYLDTFQILQKRVKIKK